MECGFYNSFDEMTEQQQFQSLLLIKSQILKINVPLSAIGKKMDQCDTIFTWNNGDEVIGLCAVKERQNKNNKATMIEFLVIDPEYRNKNMSAHFFNQINMYYSDNLTRLSCEMSNTDGIDFYKHNNFLMYSKVKASNFYVIDFNKRRTIVACALHDFISDNCKSSSLQTENLINNEYIKQRKLTQIDIDCFTHEDPLFELANDIVKEVRQSKTIKNHIKKFNNGQISDKELQDKFCTEYMKLINYFIELDELKNNNEEYKQVLNVALFVKAMQYEKQHKLEQNNNAINQNDIFVNGQKINSLPHQNIEKQNKTNDNVLYANDQIKQQMKDAQKIKQNILVDQVKYNKNIQSQPYDSYKNNEYNYKNHEIKCDIKDIFVHINNKYNTNDQMIENQKNNNDNVQAEHKQK